jgi:uncharacterized protein YbjT (DUF2867 family)
MERKRILLTGATGYIGKRLLPVLLDAGHEVVCCVRDKGRFRLPPHHEGRVTVCEVDFLDRESTSNIPGDIDAAYYLIHSMSGTSADFTDNERTSAVNFRDAVNRTRARQVIYLSGMVHNDHLSKHLASRKAVEEVLKSGDYACTTLRAGIIVGSGSASFEIIRDLVEKLPVMIGPKWLNTRCQPIAISDVLTFLKRALLREELFGKSYDIGGPDVLTYREMLLRFARIRGLKRVVYTVPVMTPRLSSYWLYFVTSTSYPLAVSLVESMHVEVIARDAELQKILGITPLSYDESIRRAFMKIEQNHVISSWKDSIISGQVSSRLSAYVEVPQYGCFTDRRIIPVKDEQATLDKIWSLGGETGWYYGTFLWRIRGFLDKLMGGVGLRRGRTHPEEIHPGDALDFWRVLFAHRDEKRLLLLAEMKLPGDAWLEFKIEDGELIQTATFRPKGLWGRLYWYTVFPFHEFVFRGMARRLAR